MDRNGRQASRRPFLRSTTAPVVASMTPAFRLIMKTTLISASTRRHRDGRPSADPRGCNAHQIDARRPRCYDLGSHNPHTTMASICYARLLQTHRRDDSRSKRCSSRAAPRRSHASARARSIDDARVYNHFASRTFPEELRLDGKRIVRFANARIPDARRLVGNLSPNDRRLCVHPKRHKHQRLLLRPPSSLQ
jgi:hypothetical protein